MAPLKFAGRSSSVPAQENVNISQQGLWFEPARQIGVGAVKQRLEYSGFVATTDYYNRGGGQTFHRAQELDYCAIWFALMDDDYIRTHF